MNGLVDNLMLDCGNSTLYFIPFVIEYQIETLKSVGIFFVANFE